MQTLALISVYAPVLIIILAVLAIQFSFFWVFLPLPCWLSSANRPATESILAMARTTATTLTQTAREKN